MTSKSIEPGFLARLFSSAVIKELSIQGCSPLAASILRESGIFYEYTPTIPLRDFFDQIYEVLFQAYRNEYIYKNVIAQKILIGKHSLNTTSMLTEFRTGICKADVVLLNGTSTVYEIKSAYDSIERLKRQIAAYRQLFDNINVITAASQLVKVREVVGPDIGLMLLTDRNTISTVQKPASLKVTVQPSVIFDSLRKNEYEQIIKMHFGVMPNMPNTRMYRACRDLFCSLAPTVAHDAMVTVLKKRGNSKPLREFINSVPYSLKAAAISCKLSSSQQNQFLKLLDAEIGTCLAI
ncbi:MAG: sce7726 family protein [Nitrospirae bacterium]|nr:sce7726 family protein [Nitrospirota bacterium]